jgi:hypothetical protein
MKANEESAISLNLIKALHRISFENFLIMRGIFKKKLFLPPNLGENLIFAGFED